MDEQDSHLQDAHDLRRCALSELLFRAYRWRRLRSLCERLALRLEGGHFYSATLRRILSAYHGVVAGAYSYGEGLRPGSFPPGVIIHRYVSIARNVRVFVRNHPFERLSLHPFFYCAALNFVPEDNIPTGWLVIESDAWIGENALITPSCHRIGLSAVVGTGAVVTKDVPDFAIVGGNPAHLIRFRVSERARELIRASRWWERPVQECAQFIDAMATPLGADPEQHPLLRAMVAPHRSAGAV